MKLPVNRSKKSIEKGLDKQERSALALRENLLRRKQQARARSAPKDVVNKVATKPLGR